MNRQHRHIRRRDPADAQGLAETSRREFDELLAGFVAQACTRRVVDRCGMSFSSICAKRSICLSWRAM